MIIYQVELTNYCNSACPWCDNKTMKRNRGFMSRETFERVVSLLKQEPPPEGVVGLHHFGESLLHPEIESYLSYLEQNNIHWRLSTNGRLLKKAEIRDMLLKQKNGLLVISLENGAELSNVNKLIQEKKERGSQLKILLQTFGDTDLSRVILGDYKIFRIQKHSWAKSGQGNYQKCCFLLKNWVCVLWDGTIVSCCMDMEGEAKLGHVFSGYHSPNQPWRACRTCEVVLPCSK